MNSFFVASTGQNVGKTTVCLGLVSLLKKKAESIGFLKPVGQEHVEIESGIHVDKDVLLFKSKFKLKDPYEEMSPVLFPRGFTRDFLDGKVHHQTLVQNIKSAYEKIRSRHEIVVVEGTGHIGVGSIVDLNNAQVAALLKLPVILIASGGLGSSIDELALNFAFCEKVGAKVAGVILNRVLEEKRQMILDYIPKALKKWDIPLLGCIPFHSFLSSPTMNDFEILFQTELLSGSEFAFRHFEQIRVAATTVELFRSHILPNQLIITPAGREDILLAILTRFWDLKITKSVEDLQVGLILTGKHPPKDSILSQIKRANIPTLYVPLSSFICLKMIHSYTLKIRASDKLKVKEALHLVEKHIDSEKLQKALQPEAL